MMDYTANSLTRKTIAVAYGDGIGPEIMEAVLHVLVEAGALLDVERVEIGEKVYQRGHESGIEPSVWETLHHAGIMLKAPITTPQGGAFRSLNMTIRKSLGLFASVRPCVSYHPFVQTRHPQMDVVVIRENEEDLYGGVEYRVSSELCCSDKLTSRFGSERVIRYAFEYAKRHNRKKVSCFTKDNIMKFTDGQFHKSFDRVSANYPEIQSEHLLVDLGAARLANSPEVFDVIVMPNMYGDILSDVAAQLSGSVGLAGTANIGQSFAVFEAIHGSAPRRAGQNMANPSGLLLASVMMLAHIGQCEVASKIHNAWLCTVEEGVHTYDIFSEGVSRFKVGTKEFARAVVGRLGKIPEKLKAVYYNPQSERIGIEKGEYHSVASKVLVGVDVNLHWSGGSAFELAALLRRCEFGGIVLKGIYNRGTKVWPEGIPETLCLDSWCCRFLSAEEGRPLLHDQVAELLARLAAEGLDFVKVQNLSLFDGQKGYFE